jgi:hypothetical protein
MSSPATDVWNERIAFLKDHGLPDLKGICATFVQTAASLICGEDDVFECFGENVENFEQVLDFLRDDPAKLKVVLEAVEKVDVFNTVQRPEEADSTLNQLKAAIALHYLVHGKDCRAMPADAEEQPTAKKAKTESETPEATPEEVAKESAGNETPEKLADEETPTLA